MYFFRLVSAINQLFNNWSLPNKMSSNCDSSKNTWCCTRHSYWWITSSTKTRALIIDWCMAAARHRILFCATTEEIWPGKNPMRCAAMSRLVWQRWSKMNVRRCRTGVRWYEIFQQFNSWNCVQLLYSTISRYTFWRHEQWVYWNCSSAL